MNIYRSIKYLAAAIFSHRSFHSVGTIFTLAERDDIVTIDDIKDRTVAATEMGDFSGAQVQFYTIHDAGMDFIMDPKKVGFVLNIVWDWIR